jgi:hypothetical protein
MLFSSCAHNWTMMAASAGYLSSIVPDMYSPASALAQCKGQAFGILNDENNYTHPPAEFTIIDPFWLDVVVVTSNNEPSGTVHGTESIDLNQCRQMEQRRRSNIIMTSVRATVVASTRSRRHHPPQSSSPNDSTRPWNRPPTRGTRSASRPSGPPPTFATPSNTE